MSKSQRVSTGIAGSIAGDIGAVVVTAALAATHVGTLALFAVFALLLAAINLVLTSAAFSVASALASRAPSMWILRPRRLASSPAARSSSICP